jgi:hypothetical protein
MGGVKTHSSVARHREARELIAHRMNRGEQSEDLDTDSAKLSLGRLMNNTGKIKKKCPSLKKYYFCIIFFAECSPLDHDFFFHFPSGENISGDALNVKIFLLFF